MDMKLQVMSMFSAFILFTLQGCSTMNFQQTVEKVELKRYFTRWYVIAGRVTSFEDGAYNPTETYTWNESEKRIDIDFKFNKDSFQGKVKTIPQKGWIENETTNATWKISPFWPLKFTYLIIALDADYEWTVVGVPNGKYIWIMASKPTLPKGKLEEIIKLVGDKGYPVQEIKTFPQQQQ